MEKQILHYKDYTIDEYGRIYSYKTGKRKMLKPWLDSKKRYYVIGLSEKGKVIKYNVHRLVALVFIPNPNNKTDVDHIDCNTHNNQVSNLRWTDHKENIHHSYKTVGPVRNYKIVQLFKNNKLIHTFQSISLACEYASKKYNISYSSLQKYGRTGNFEIKKIGVTTIENIKIIKNLDEVE